MSSLDGVSFKETRNLEYFSIFKLDLAFGWTQQGCVPTIPYLFKITRFFSHRKIVYSRVHILSFYAYWVPHSKSPLSRTLKEARRNHPKKKIEGPNSAQLQWGREAFILISHLSTALVNRKKCSFSHFLHFLLQFLPSFSPLSSHNNRQAQPLHRGGNKLKNYSKPA